MTKHIAYTLTINNYTEAEYKKFLHTKCNYSIVGKEQGKEGTPHLQCYIHFSSEISFKSIKKHFPRAHIEVARGSAKQNREYCMKEGNFKEKGTLPRQGKRTDLDELCEMVQNNCSDAEISERFPKAFMMFNKHINALRFARHTKKTLPNFFKVMNRGVQNTFNYVKSLEDDVVYVEELKELASYNRHTFRTILFNGELHSSTGISTEEMYTEGYIPLTYKIGYEYRHVICQNFVIMYTPLRYEKSILIDIGDGAENEEERTKKEHQTDT